VGEIVKYQRPSGRRLKSLPPREGDRRQKPDRRQSDRRRSTRRRSDRPRTVLIALLGLAVGAYAALTVRTADLTGQTASARFALCGDGVWRACVVDGDTIRYDGATIRLADINAPETRGAKCASERRLGRRAALRLRALLNAGPFELVTAGQRDIDAYGRKLRILRRGGRSLGDTLVAEGLARPWSGRRRSWCG
jgi:endonuclease YncB( thermonuclease family)